MKQPVLKKSMEQTKAEWVLLIELQEEKEPPQLSRRYGNGIRMRRFAVQADSQKFAHLYDLPVSRVKIFSALRKKKIAKGKRLQNIAVWLVSFSEHKFNKPKAQSLRLKTF
jgi:hypothetical protein